MNITWSPSPTSHRIVAADVRRLRLEDGESVNASWRRLLWWRKATRGFSPFAHHSLLAMTFLAALLITVTASAATSRPLWTSGRVAGSPYPPAPYSVERLFSSVTFDHPIDLAFIPGTEQLLVADQSGTFWSFDTQAAAPKTNLVFRLRDHHQPLDSVLGFAFHPGFVTNRFIFINYNEPGGRTNGSFVSRFTLSSLNPLVIDPASEKVILRWLSGGHNGCTLAFGNDGMLYISTGDAAAPDPPDMPFRTGQDISDLLSSILRIDVDHPSGDLAYSIPADNPFVNLSGARGEVWAFGFRNPFRMSIDRATGEVWAGDVGWEQWEMVYHVKRGGNYGWALTEGPNPSVRTDVKPGPGPILPPMVAIHHTDGASITGGYVYRGTRLSKLRGAYIYGDWETGRFWALRHEGDQLLSNDELCDTTLKPVAFTLDPRGELLILDYNSGVYRLVPSKAPLANEAFPRKLGATGLFTSLNPLTPAPGTIPYRPAAPMWNDHATAEWLLAVPGDGAIVTEGGVGNIAGATWFFPTNTVLARTLTLEMETGKLESKRRIETQLLHWDGQAWNPYTYRWNEPGTDAEVVLGAGTNEVFTVKDATAPGGMRETPWRFASRTECLRCHNAWAGEALTLTWQQLGNPKYAAGTELQRLQDLGVLRVKNPNADAPARLVNPYDTAAAPDHRARAWLHANCASCHRFGAGGTALIHLNADKPLTEARVLDEKPIRGDFGIAGARIIASGEPYRSTLLYRIMTEGAGHMPLLGTRLVDETGVKLVRDWIRSLPPKAGNDPDLAPARRLAAEISQQIADLKSAPRTEAFAKLLETTAGSLALLSETTDPVLLAKATRMAARQGNAITRDLFQRLLPPEDRRRTLGADIQPPSILALPGNAARGRELFLGTAQCANCHVVGAQGRNFGPELSGVARKYTRAQLLEQILQPSKIIAPEFKTTVATLKDEAELSGFVIKRTGDSLQLRDANLNEHTVRLDDIKASHESALSAMPEGLLAPLTAQEAADVLEFLAALEPVAQGK